MKEILIEKFPKDETLRVPRGRRSAPRCNSFRIGGLMRVFITAMVFVGMLTSSNSYVWAAQQTVSVNQVMNTVFNFKKSDMLSDLKKGLQKKSFSRGQYFKGEILEYKGVAKDVGKVDIQLKKAAHGFLLTARRGEYKIVIPVEFVDILEGKIRVAGRDVQLRKEMSYLELARSVSFLFSPLYRKKAKGTVFYQSPQNWFIKGALAEEGRLPRFEPIDLPPPYRKLTDKLVDRAKIVVPMSALYGGVAGMYGGAVGGGGAAIGGAVAGVAAGAAGGGAAVAAAGGAAVAAGGGAAVVGGGGAVGVAAAGAGAMASKGLLALGATSGASLAGAVIAGAAVFTAGVFGMAYLIDSVVLGVSKVDDLYRVGTYLNGVRDSCVEDRKTYYRKDGKGDFSLDLKKIVSFSNDEQTKLNGFRYLWAAAHQSGAGASSGLSCTRIISKEGLDHLLEKGIGFPRREGKSRKQNKKGNRAIASLCQTLEGIVQCYQSVPSPYGEKGVAEKESIKDTRRALEEKGEGLVEVYESLSGEVLR